jgi:hypothetical protein
MTKSALEKIESHEKLCRIMQKQTHDRMEKIEGSIGRIEKILIGCASGEDMKCRLLSLAFLHYYKQ